MGQCHVGHGKADALDLQRYKKFRGDVMGRKKLEHDVVMKKKRFAMMVADENKMLRCAPQTGTPYVPGCHVAKGSMVEVCEQDLESKYLLVRSHCMVGYIRKRHLCMLPEGDAETLKTRRRSLLAVWAMTRKGCGDLSAVTVLANLCAEMVPWWLLSGQGRTHAERYCSTQMPDDCLMRSLSSPVSSVRRKELAKSLSQWKDEFTKSHGRGPHALDVWTDGTVQKMYEEYEAIGKYRSVDSKKDNLTVDEHARFRSLCKVLKGWMSKYEELHHRLPSKKRILGDSEVASVYIEYLSLSAKRKEWRGDPKPTGPSSSGAALSASLHRRTQRSKRRRAAAVTFFALKQNGYLDYAVDIVSFVAPDVLPWWVIVQRQGGAKLASWATAYQAANKKAPCRRAVVGDVHAAAMYRAYLAMRGKHKKGGSKKPLSSPAPLVDEQPEPYHEHEQGERAVTDSPVHTASPVVVDAQSEDEEDLTLRPPERPPKSPTAAELQAHVSSSVSPHYHVDTTCAASVVRHGRSMTA